MDIGAIVIGFGIGFSIAAVFFNVTAENNRRELNQQWQEFHREEMKKAERKHLDFIKWTNKKAEENLAKNRIADFNANGLPMESPEITAADTEETIKEKAKAFTATASVMAALHHLVITERKLETKPYAVASWAEYLNPDTGLKLKHEEITGAVEIIEPPEYAGKKFKNLAEFGNWQEKVYGAQD